MNDCDSGVDLIVEKKKKKMGKMIRISKNFELNHLISVN